MYSCSTYWYCTSSGRPHPAHFMLVCPRNSMEGPDIMKVAVALSGWKSCWNLTTAAAASSQRSYMVAFWGIPIRR